MKGKINILFLIITSVLVLYYLVGLKNEFSHTRTSQFKRAFKLKTTSGALQSMQFLNEMRAFPDRDIPHEKFFEAFEYVKTQMEEYNSGKDSPTQWSPIGPNNIGGRTLGLAVHPVDTSILFIGAASGGLWKSVTGGIGANAWNYVNTGYPNLAVSSIVIDSVNPNIMYIGTGENYGYQYSLNGIDVRVTRGMYGIGILKTTDGGSTWAKSLDWSYNNERGVWKVLMNPQNHNVLYAVTSEGVYKTDNAGAAWFQVLNYQMAVDIEINPIDTNVVYVSIGNLSNYVPNANVGFYKTTNSGSTWVKLAGGLPSNWTGKSQLDIYKRNPDRIYASITDDFSSLGIYLSTDAGASWSLQPGTSSNYLGSQGWFTNAFLVNAADSSKVVVGGVDIYKSVTSGSNLLLKSYWYKWLLGVVVPPGGPEGSDNTYAHADHHNFISNPKDPNKVYIASDGGLFRSNDFCESFYGCNGGYQTTQFYHGFANSYYDTTRALGGLQDNATARYQGTNSWMKVFGGDGFWCAINSTSQNTAYVEYTYGQIKKSNDGAINNFSSITPPTSGNANNACFSAPYILSHSNPNIMFAGNKSIYKSTVGGGSWLGPYGSFGGAKVVSMDMSFNTADTLYCGTIPVQGGVDANVWHSVDGGLTWTGASSGQLPNRYPIDIFVQQNNSAVAYAVFSGFGTGHVYKTTNTGVTWSNISGNLPDVPHQSVTVDPQYPQNIYTGNDLGVFVTTNSGINWYEYSDGMPYAMVFDLVVVYPNRHLRAVTHGHGVYERSLIQNPIGLVSNNNEVPKEFNLSQNYPNPFNPSTNIKFTVPKESNVLLKIFDISGKEVFTLVNEKLNAGSYSLKWDASVYSSGVYFYRMTTNGNFAETKKMILVK